MTQEKMKGSLGNTNCSKVGIGGTVPSDGSPPGDEERNTAGTISSRHVNPPFVTHERHTRALDGVTGCSLLRDSMKQRVPGQTHDLTTDSAC